MINGVSNVGIEVDDQDRAKAFWIDRLGFELVQDTPTPTTAGAGWRSAPRTRPS
jgi:catechol 2,3-dioxygenase-like lactoylglutathione lyase family enzyme